MSRRGQGDNAAPARTGPSGKTGELDRLLYRTLEEMGDPPSERRVFVNRALRMESIRCVGFDLDWTLADYRRKPMERLAFDLAVDHLIEEAGYAEGIRAAELRPDFPRRGLLIDKEIGTVLRMSRHRFVNRAFLGRRSLDRAELRQYYRYEPIRPSSGRFYHLDSLFELPEANLFSELMELVNSGTVAGIPPPQQLFKDVRAAIDWVHGGSSLKERVLARPEKYLHRERELGLALHRLALEGRRLILITNSGWRYASGICSFLFDGLLPGLDTWRELFDLVVVSSGKPEFFRGKRPFTALEESGREIGTADVPDWGGVYAGGCHEGLMQLLRVPGERVLYVGDHIYGDIVSSKLESTWRTALIVRELEREIQTGTGLAAALERQQELRNRLSAIGRRMDHLRDLVLLDRKLRDEAGEDWQPNGPTAEFERLTREHRKVLQEENRCSEEIAERFNPHWGSFFKQGAIKTRFASQLETYACLYTSRVSNFLYYGSQHYFRVIRDPMMHEI